MKQIHILIILFIPLLSFSQNHSVEGKIYDYNNQPLVGANIYIKGSYYGATSDTNGFFRLEYTLKDTTILVVSFIGYETYNKILRDNQNSSLEIELQSDSDMLDEIIITAGTFEASDKKRAVLLDALDIATTASSEGDIYGALSTFPGAVQQGETGKIIVRGGEAHETKTYIDGMLVSSPYTSSYPDMPSRGRFTPFMFDGVTFSTGGYSAEYGQALSSVLELKTPGLFDQNLTSLSIMNVGFGLSHTHRGEKSAISAEANYNNLVPYFLMAKHELDWIDIPESYSGNIKYRIKTGKTGLIKVYAGYNQSNSKLNYSMNGNEKIPVGMSNRNLFINSVYNTEIKENWLMKVGLSYNTNIDIKEIENAEISDNLSSFHSRIGFQNIISRKMNIRYGVEAFNEKLDFVYSDITTPHSFPLYSDNTILASYIEADAMVGKKLAIRTGLRNEYSPEIKNNQLSPRISLACKLNTSSQLSLAYGSFYQQAISDYSKYNSNLKPESARHYILNYQLQKNNRLFRTEVYLKYYDNLITYTPGKLQEYDNIANNGNGYASGIDIFWRDKQTFRLIDYWLSYSYIDSKRKYKDFPTSATPDFLSAHNFSAVYKQWIPILSTQLSLTYNFSSGRPYENPYTEGFMNESTSEFHNLSGSLSYVTKLFDQYTVVHLSVNNILGLDKIYTYKYYSNQSGADLIETPVKSMMQRTIIIGVFISFN